MPQSFLYEVGDAVKIDCSSFELTSIQKYFPDVEDIGSETFRIIDRKYIYGSHFYYFDGVLTGIAERILMPVNETPVSDEGIDEEFERVLFGG